MDKAIQDESRAPLGARPASARGFSLLELMITIAILAILMALGAPSLRSFLTSSRLTSASSNFYDAMRYARAQAAQVNHVVLICPNTGTCGSSYDWGGSGFKVVDGNDNSVVYRTWTASGTAATLTGPFVSTPIKAVSFNPDGSTDLVGTQYLKFCDPNAKSGSSGRSIIMNSAGFLTQSVANGSTAGAYQKCP